MYEDNEVFFYFARIYFIVDNSLKYYIINMLKPVTIK